jgi:hypothetical protein
MAKVAVTIRKGRKVVKSTTVDFTQIIDRLIDLTMGAHAPINARAQLAEGNTYKYKDSGYGVTLSPLYGEEY